MFVAVAVSAGSAGAQSTAPSAGQPKAAGQSAGKSRAQSTGKSTAKAATPSADQPFAREAATGGMAEVELGTLAKGKASNADVKQFADRMVTDHGKAGDELKQWAQQKKVTLPTAIEAKHKATQDRLSKLSGDAFDKAYMRDMVTDHEHDVAAFKREAASGKDPDLKAWAAKTLPTLEDHLKMARDTAAKVGAHTAPTSAKKK